jgi:protein-S-isoprenylcysteine O-methyltransferase Ste14
MDTTAHDNTYRGIAASAWIIYTIIVFEIIFMVSPFALYYYSVYSLPLNLLQTNPATSWLTLHILPHFTYTDSLASNLLILISWPLIILGSIMFLLGFAQVYWAKFTRRGAVAVGLYKWIRHPQYLALAIVGLGTTIFWSRFIVLIAYVTMLCMYYALARLEERLCVQKFGEKYEEYLSGTGMFLPEFLTGWMPKMHDLLPKGTRARVAVFVALYLLLLFSTVGGGWLLKYHVLGQIDARYSESMTMIALAPLDKSALPRIEELLAVSQEFQRNKADAGLERVIAYVAPESWSVPELGLMSDGSYSHSGLEEMLHPTVHGNPLDFDADQVSVLIAEPIVADSNAKGKDLLLSTLGYVPRILIKIDLAEGRMTSISQEPYESSWKGIPVPVY